MLSSINIGGRLINLSEPRVMGILNVTPDSFYKGSRRNHEQEILNSARQMLEEGATFLDVGGYSSRPGADHIPEIEEIKRIKTPIELLKSEFPEAILSIDTFRTGVAEVAVKSGASMVNDISGGHLDNKMYDFIADSKVPYIAMHMKGTPQTMKELSNYQDMLKEITYYFSEILEKLTGKGVSDVILDPGFGFAKNIQQNFELLRSLDYLRILEHPLLAGLSRKSMIYKTLKNSPGEALNGTTVLNTLALQKGVSILRVHDVKPAVEAITLLKKTAII